MPHSFSKYKYDFYKYKYLWYLNFIILINQLSLCIRLSNYFWTHVINAPTGGCGGLPRKAADIARQDDPGGGAGVSPEKSTHTLLDQCSWWFARWFCVRAVIRVWQVSTIYGINTLVLRLSATKPRNESLSGTCRMKMVYLNIIHGPRPSQQ